jgi:hypothetical protein
MTKTQVIAKLTQPKSGKHIGDLVGWSMSGWAMQDDVDAAVTNNGLDSHFSFSKLGPENAYRKAVQLSVRGGGEVDVKAFEVQMLETGSDKIVHAVIERNVEDVGDVGLSTKDAQSKTLYKVGFDKAAAKAGKPASQLLQIEAAGNGHVIAERIRDMYKELAIVYRIETIRAEFQRAFHRWGGCRMVALGGIWWIPPSRANEIRAWASFMKEVYGDRAAFTCPQYDAEETIEALREASDQDLEGRLQKIEDKLEDFAKAETVQVSTLEARLAEYSSLRDIVDLHDDLLGMRREALREKLAAAEKSLTETIDTLRASK